MTGPWQTLFLLAGCMPVEGPLDPNDPRLDFDDSLPDGVQRIDPNPIPSITPPDEPLVYVPRTVATEPELKVAFLGDQGIGLDAMRVMEFLAQEVDLVVWLGDYDYMSSPSYWETQMDVALGDDFPWLAAIGNHDLPAWSEYAQVLDQHIAKMPEAQCEGLTGIQQACSFRGLEVLLSGVGTTGEDHDQWINETLAADDHIWRVCAWHKNQRDMQIGSKWDEVGWEAYQACQNGAAIVTTGHEHSYARTRTLTDVGDLATGHGAYGATDTMLVSNGSTFVAVSGTAGQAYRAYYDAHATDTWWASWYTSTSYMRNGTPMAMPSSGAEHGALIITFNVDGDPYRAHGEFKTWTGVVIDSFEIYSL